MSKTGEQALALEKILSLPAGQEMDCLVAVHFMGWSPTGTNLGSAEFVLHDEDGDEWKTPPIPPDGREGQSKCEFCPSRLWCDMQYVLKIYQERREVGHAVSLHLGRRGKVSAEFCLPPSLVTLETQKDLVVLGNKFAVFAETMPLAVCRGLLIVTLGGWAAGRESRERL